VRLELKDIKGGVLEQGYVCSAEDFPDLVAVAEEGGPVYDGPIRFFLRLQRSGQIVEVDGRFEASLLMQCGHCLQPFQRALAESFSLTFTPCEGGEEGLEEEVELEALELDMVPYHDEVLELRNPLQEQLVMAIPISPLCSETCKGLCPECGADLNQKQCGCTKKPFNSKFSVLAGIKLKE